MFALLLASIVGMSASDYRTLQITTDTVLTPADVHNTRIVVAASNVTIDGQGLELIGPGIPGNLDSFEKTGEAVLVDGYTNVTIRNLKARGFEIGLAMRNCKAPKVERCEFSHNYSNADFGWGELPPRGGMVLENVRWGVFRSNKANDVWDALSLRDCDDNLFLENDLAHATNTCAKLWNSSRNKFLENDLSYGIRIDRAKGEVHARDSTSVLIESGSNDNYFYGNDITHGGDGVFIRPLNGWVSTGNVFVENDTSHANNNCVESWSPGNTYVRNIANHGSYGFWLGGSDRTVLIGNEASYNGLPTGYHNAPEAIFGHGGIVIVGGSSTHTLIEGNRAVGNNGGGIVFRGDKDGSWSTEHWIVQNNRLEENQWPIWGRYGNWITIGPNNRRGNANPDSVEETVNLVTPAGKGQKPPVAVLRGPSRAAVGQEVAFDASASTGKEYTWQIEGRTYTTATVKHRFEAPGFYRVGVNVVSDGLADMAWRDVIVSEHSVEEIGTEGSAVLWRGDNGFTFEDDEDSVVGATSLKMTPVQYQGVYATATLNGHWSLSGKKRLVFWMKAQNPNIPGFQSAGPVITLGSAKGKTIYQPAKEANLYGKLPYSEARETWMRVVIPIEGGDGWDRKTEGDPDLRNVSSLSIAMDSWGGEPFTLWIDGLHAE